MTETGTPNKMGLSELLNANLSKKMGLGMLGMYLVSETTDVYIALIIAGIAVFGITAQGFIDYNNTQKGSPEPAPD